MAITLDAKHFRDKYLKDWDISVENDLMDVRDPHGNILSRVARSTPKTVMKFRGKPVTIDNMVNGSKRIAIWMPGEEGRTRPLVEETFRPEDYFELAHKAAITMPSYGGPDVSPDMAFPLWWAQENYKHILEAEDRRDRGYSYLDKGVWDPNQPVPKVGTRSFVGEDGKTYVETDPVLTKALAEKHREDLEAKRLAEEARERRERELEAIPGFGSF